LVSLLFIRQKGYQMISITKAILIEGWFFCGRVAFHQIPSVKSLKYAQNNDGGDSNEKSH
jgi:hypothetical protein